MHQIKGISQHGNAGKCKAFLETRKAETCRTEPMAKESSKKIIQNQGRKLTV